MGNNIIYTEEIGKQILGKLHAKGWNAYKSTNSSKIGADYIIKNLLADNELGLNERYVVLPFAENPTDPVQVMNSLDKLAVRLNKETPTIQINGERFPWTGFIPRESNVKINTISGDYLSYPAFLRALETIVQV